MIPIQMAFSPFKTAAIPLKGGINENVSSIELQAGELIDCRNYMLAEGGYGGYISTKGFERFDGITTPSLTVSYILKLSDCTGVPEVSDVITSDASSDTVEVLAVHPDGSTFILECTGTDPVFAKGGTVSIGGIPLGIIVYLKTLIGGTVDYHVALDASRGDVLEVPGEGPILGVHIWKSKVYALRKAVGANEVHMYKEDAATGWSAVTQASPLVYTGSHKFHFSNYNFLATEAGARFYLCDGQNKARECNGTSLVVVDNAGMDPNDKPTNILAINDYLFLSYRGGSLQTSTLGSPLDFTTAPHEFGMGSEIVSLIDGPSNTLVINTESGIKILHGNTEETFQLETFSEDVGTIPYTTTKLLGTIVFVTPRGVATLEAVEVLGDFSANSISQRFKDTLSKNRKHITVASTHRELNQYRLFFSSGLAIYVSFEGKEFSGATLMDFRKPINVIAQGEDSSGSELHVFGSAEGYVYKMDSGTSLDGESIPCRLTTSFYHYGSMRNMKAFKRATLEIDGENGQHVMLRANFDYLDPTQPRSILHNPSLYTISGGAVWGEGVWGDMVWGAESATDRVPILINGIGTSMSYKIISNEKYRKQHTIQSLITDFNILGRRP